MGSPSADITSLLKHLDGSVLLSHKELSKAIVSLNNMISSAEGHWTLFLEAKKCYYKIESKQPKPNVEFAKSLMYFLNFLDQAEETWEDNPKELLDNLNGALLYLNENVRGLLIESMRKSTSYSSDGAKTFIALEGFPQISNPLTTPKI